MAFSPRLIILIALILSVSISPSFGRRERHKHKHHHREIYESENIPDGLEQELRDLCSQTDDSNVCWHIIKPQLSQFNDTDPPIVTDVLLDLSCSKNYNDAVRNLNIAKSNLDSEEYGNIPIQIEDTQQELEGCRGEFGEGSFDPGHIGNRINEFELYVNIVRVSVGSLLDWETSKVNN